MRKTALRSLPLPSTQTQSEQHGTLQQPAQYYSNIPLADPDSKLTSSLGLEDLIDRVIINLNLSWEVSEVLILAIFQEIRDLMLQGEIVHLTNLGRFLISSPKQKNTLVKIFPKFKLFKQVVKELNDAIE